MRKGLVIKVKSIINNLFPLNLVKILVFVFSFLLVTGYTFLYAQDKGLSDDEIEDAVETELWIDNVVNMNRIDIGVIDGVVTITGTVDNLLAKERAEKICESIVGVRAIINRIEVKPNERFSDKELESLVKDALLKDPATESYEISVETQNGIVTLNGKVDSWQEKQLAGAVAKGVNGVTAVNNRIDFTFAQNRSDQEIEKEIKAVLANDVLVDDNLIQVDVNDQKVNLSGAVGSLAEKDRAIRDSWVSGVEMVKSADLKIEWWARDRMRRNGYAENVSDADIKDALETSYLYDPRISSFNPEIKVNNGRITLKGVVSNLRAKEAAAEDAKNVVGVWQVRNHLKVQPPIIPENSELRGWVAQALINDPYIDRSQIKINTSYGIVYLSGTVHTSFEKYHAELVTERVRGVTTVVNNLEYKYVWKWKPDREIKKDVEEQLRWSLFVNDRGIDVSVNDGVVTLTGEVNNRGAYDAAEKNAYEGGAKDVINKLKVLSELYGPSDNYILYPHPRFKDELE